MHLIDDRTLAEGQRIKGDIPNERMMKALHETLGLLLLLQTCVSPSCILSSSFWVLIGSCLLDDQLIRLSGFRHRHYSHSKEPTFPLGKTVTTVGQR